MEKWWAAYEMFCGPRTEIVAAYLEPLVTEEHRKISRQLWLDAHQRAHQIAMNVDGSLFTPTSIIPRPLNWHSHPEPSLISSDPFFHGARLPSAQPTSLSPAEEKYGLSKDDAHSNNSLTHLHAQHTLGPIHPLQSLQLEGSNLPYLAQWQLQSPQMSASQENLWSSPPVQNYGEENLHGLMARLHLIEAENRRVREEKQQLEEENRQLKELTTIQAQREQKHLNIIDKMISNLALHQSTTSGAESKDIEKPTSVSTPTRSNTDNSTASDLSGIAERDPHSLGTVEEFNKDLASDLFDEPEQELRDVQYLPEMELGVPRALQGMPSVDSGYGTNKTDDSAPQFVKPSDTMRSPMDMGITFTSFHT